MLTFVVIAFLAAFGLVCTVWTLCGFFIHKDQGVLFYRGNEPEEFARRYLWLKEMGFLQSRLVVADPPESALPWLKDQGIGVIFEDNIPADRREKS